MCNIETCEEELLRCINTLDKLSCTKNLICAGKQTLLGVYVEEYLQGGIALQREQLLACLLQEKAHLAEVDALFELDDELADAELLDARHGGFVGAQHAIGQRTA